MCGMILNRASIQIRDREGNIIEVAREDTVEGIREDIAKLKPTDDHYSVVLTVTTVPIQVSEDTMIREEITIICDEGNKGKVYLGNSDMNLPIPLNAGDTITIKKCSLSRVWLKSENGTQTVYIDAGGGW